MEPFNYLNSLLGYESLNQNTSLLDFGNILIQKNFKEITASRIITCSNFISQAKYVNKGLLTACIYGEHFTTPTSSLILRTVRELTHDHYGGILILLPRGSPALFNTGLAIERAKSECILAKLFIVDPKCVTDYLGLPVSISLAAKAAGAMVSLNKSLDEIISYCRQLNERSICYFVDFERDNVVRPMTGTGRNGVKLFSEKNVVEEFVNKLLKEVDTTGEQKTEIIVLLTSIGIDLQEKELFSIINELIKQLVSANFVIQRLFIDKVTIESRMKKVSVIVLRKFDEELLNYLDMPCETPIWDQIHQTESLTVAVPIPSGLRRKFPANPPVKGPRLNVFQTHTLELAVQFACDALISCERQINIIDSERSAGNLGTRLKTTSEKLKQRIKDNKIHSNCPFTFLFLMGKLLENTLGGTIGSIYGILFNAASNYFGNFSEKQVVIPEMWLQALQEAVKSFQAYSHVKFGDQTLFDPIWGCVEVVENEILDGVNFLNAFENGVSAAEQIAANTKFTYIKYPDSGAHSAGIWMRAVFEAVKLKCA